MDPVLRWHRALHEQSSFGADFLARVYAAGLHFGDRPLCTFARPLFISPNQVQQYAGIMRSFHQAIRFTREMIEADGLEGSEDSLAVRLGMPLDALELASQLPDISPTSPLHLPYISRTSRRCSMRST